MIIGLSLPFEYLAGTGDTADAKCFSESFGRPFDCLTELKDHGLCSIELRGFGPDSSADRILDVAQSILGLGMKLTLHGYLTGNMAGLLFVDAYPQLLPTIDFLREQQEETVMVVHALADPRLSKNTIVKTTNRTLKRLAESVHTYNLPVRVGLEINRYHGVETPDTTYDGLLEMTQSLSCPEVGL